MVKIQTTQAKIVKWWGVTDAMAGVFDMLSPEQKLRLALKRDVQAIYKEAAQILELEVHDQAVELVTELTWKKLQSYAFDLEAFAKHARRTTVNAEDVKLLVRRNQNLKAYIMTLIETASTSNAPKDKKKKSTTANGAGPSTSNGTDASTSTKDKPSEDDKQCNGKDKENEKNGDTIDLT